MWGCGGKSIPKPLPTDAGETGGSGGGFTGGAGGSFTGGAGGSATGGAGGSDTGGAGGGFTGGAGGSATGGAAGGAADGAVDGPADGGGVPDGAAGDDGGSDAAVACTEGAACSLAGAGAGLCKSGACVACIDTTDDTACATAYGGGRLCAQGVCAAGDCHASADCKAASAKAGELCGVTTPNTCGSCTADTQCQSDSTYGATTVCFTKTGQANSGRCVDNTSQCTGITDGQSCPINAADVCCGAKCTGGDCCVDSDCVNNVKFGQGYACVSHSCTKCAAAVGNQYTVDPVRGDDTTGTGNPATAPSCSFRTITRALQYIGSVAPVGTKIIVKGAAGSTTSLYVTASGGVVTPPETLPIALRDNITLTTSDGPISLTLPLKATGITVTGDKAAILPDAAAPLTIDGATVGTLGILFNLPATASASLGNVTVKAMAADGIRVTGGTVAVGAAVTVSKCATSGVRVTAGRLKVSVAAGAPPASFTDNTAHGIIVTGTGALDITGVPTLSGTGAPSGEGTVVAARNGTANIWIEQQPGTVATASRIDGVVAWGSATGNGMRLIGGSNVVLRHSVVLANAGNGILISSFNDTAAGNDLSKLDLGVVGSSGANMLQASAGANPNGVAGVCTTMSKLQGALTLFAIGNVFSGPRDCAQATPGAITRRDGANCMKADVSNAMSANTTVTFNVANCTTN
jgi:hypothetical protein